jgi:hypothetical protein
MKALYLSAVLLFLVTPLFRYSSTPPAAAAGDTLFIFISTPAVPGDSTSQLKFNPSGFL